MVSTPERFTNNSPRSPMAPTPFNKLSARKSLCLFTKIIDLKKKTATHRFGAAKSNLMAIKYGTTPRALKPKRNRNEKTKDQINKSLYNCIMNHAQVFKSQIFNDYLKVNIDGHTELQVVPKLLLQVSVR